MLSVLRTFPSLAALAAASLLAGGILGTAAVYGNKLERHSIHHFAWELARELDVEIEQPTMTREQRNAFRLEERIKNQGMSLQRKALRSPDLVSLYGSSELRKPIPDKAGIFFSQYPTGFAVFQVGRAGATCINLLQKIAAAAPADGPRRVAISLSSTWFLQPQTDARYYAGNFSKQQALHVLFDPRLSFALKRDLARRMLGFTRTVPEGSLLAVALHRLAGETAWDRAVYRIILPFGLIQNAIYSAQDHFETAIYLLDRRRAWPQEIVRATAPLDWPALLAKASAETVPHRESLSARDSYLDSDEAYVTALDRSPEWTDFELLLRTFRELHLDPLILSMPPDGLHYGKLGVTSAGLADYSRRLHELCARYDARLETFDDHIDDPAFLVDHHDHMSVKGWMYYNKAIDDFFHRRPR